MYIKEVRNPPYGPVIDTRIIASSASMGVTVPPEIRRRSRSVRYTNARQARSMRVQASRNSSVEVA